MHNYFKDFCYELKQINGVGLEGHVGVKGLYF